MSILLDSFYASTLSTFHLLYIVILGILAKKLKIVQPHFEYALSKVVTNVIIPCFIFAQIVNNFRINQFRLIMEALFGCAFIYIFGLCFGFLVSKYLLHLNKPQSHLLTALFSTPHTTSVPVVLIQAVGPVLDSFTQKRPWLTGTASDRAFVYIVMNSIYSSIWRWSAAYYLIEPELKSEMVVMDEALITKDLEDMNKQLLGDSYSSFTFKKLFYSIANTPLITAILSLCITFSPTVQRYFTTQNSLLNETLISVNIMVSKSYSFVCIFMLGLSFANVIQCGSSSEENGNNKTIFEGWDLLWLAIMKLIVMPLIAAPFIIFIFRNWLEYDDVLVFIYLLMASAPSAINILVICIYKEAYVESVSKLMIAIYGIAIITMTLQVTFFIYVLGTLNAGNAIASSVPIV